MLHKITQRLIPHSHNALGWRKSKVYVASQHSQQHHKGSKAATERLLRIQNNKTARCYLHDRLFETDARKKSTFCPTIKNLSIWIME